MSRTDTRVSFRESRSNGEQLKISWVIIETGGIRGQRDLGRNQEVVGGMDTFEKMEPGTFRYQRRCHVRGSKLKKHSLYVARAVPELC